MSDYGVTAPLGSKGIISPATEFFVRDSPIDGLEIGKLRFTEIHVTIQERGLQRHSDKGLWYLVEFSTADFNLVRDGYENVLPTIPNQGWIHSAAFLHISIPWHIFIDQILVFQSAEENFPLLTRAQITKLRRGCHISDLPFDDVIGLPIGEESEYWENRPLLESWQPLLESQAVEMPNGEIVDMYHFLVGLDVIPKDRRQKRRQIKIFGIYPKLVGENYSAATWAGDIGAGVADYAAGKSEKWEKQASRSDEERINFYFTTRAPESDLKGDIDAWGAAYNFIDNIQPLIGYTLHGIFEEYYGARDQTAAAYETVIKQNRRESFQLFLKHYDFEYAVDLNTHESAMKRIEQPIHTFADFWELRNISQSLNPWEALDTEMDHGSREMRKLFLDWCERELDKLSEFEFPTFVDKIAWNLNDAMTSENSVRRRFYPPVASVPPGHSSTVSVSSDRFIISETSDNLNDSVTRAIYLDIGINGVGQDDGALPDPAIRIHSPDSALVRFQPATDTHGDRLILEMLTPSLVNILAGPLPKWFDRWIDAGCLPQILVYENVDFGFLQSHLNVLPTEVSPVNDNYGLSYSFVVSEDEKEEFISEFLSGNEAYYLFAKPGALLGTFGTVDQFTPEPVLSQATHWLRLHAYYLDHTPDAPRPMNPRELFHLFFGNDSQEALTHPLLQRINTIGLQEQENVHPDTKRMLLRPPLRTWQRVIWEAELEKTHKDNWTPSGSVGNNRFYNSHIRDGVKFQGNIYDDVTFNRGTYEDDNKCNLFVSDICLRAGFRVGVHLVGDNADRWHFIDANSYTNLAHRINARTNIIGVAEDKKQILGKKFEHRIRALEKKQRLADFRQAMQVEGRCLVLAGARRREFRRLNNKLSNCSNALRKRGIGHIVIIKDILERPILRSSSGDGFQKLKIETIEASGSGAVSLTRTVKRGGAGNNAASSNGFIRLQVIELHPGRDPDTLQGLRDLNVRNINRNLLGNQIERAIKKKLTHKADGSPRTDNKCCQDNYPPKNAVPTEVDC